MKTTTTVLIAAAALAVGVFFSTRVHAITETATSRRTTDAAQIDRGDYLVHGAGLCTDCHTPRNERGELVAARNLAGAPIGFTPVAPMPWASAAPRLAGLPAGFTPEAMVEFLMTGDRPNGRPRPLPPMPPYRFNRADAEAIVAYLQSLPAE
jgi:mono/diheme cytochrome c family protein